MTRSAVSPAVSWRLPVVRLSPVWLAFVVLSLSTAPAGDLDVLITEVHYNVFRAGAEDPLEFVEIHNRGPAPVNVGGWHFTEGIEFTFAPGETLAPGEYAVVGANPAGSENTYRLKRVFGPFTGRLDNSGEVLALANRAGWVVNRIHFDDEDPWPKRPDGRGPSLEFTGNDNGNDQGRRWKPSLFFNGHSRRARLAADDDGTPDISDAISILLHLFASGELSCEDAADTNDDSAVDLSDPVRMLGFLFLGTEILPPPWFLCGVDPTGDDLTCETYTPCGR